MSECLCGVWFGAIGPPPFDWQTEKKPAPTISGRFDPHTPPMFFHNPPDKIQSQSFAVMLPRARSKERVEDVTLFVQRDTGSIVDDSKGV